MNVPYVLLQQDGGGVLGDLPAWLGDALSDIIAALPRLIGAIIILIIGWIVGKLLGRAIAGIADRAGIDRRARDTPLSRMLGDSRDAVSNFLGKVTAWFIYALAILAAANTLAIPILSEWLATAVSYLPAFIAGLLVIILGFIVADFVGDAIERTRAATQTAYTTWFATGVRMFLYFVVIVIGLDTMGVDVEILYTFSRALAWGLAVGVALAVGIAFGWGGKDYVSAHIDDWMGRAKRGSPTPETETETTD